MKVASSNVLQNLKRGRPAIVLVEQLSPTTLIPNTCPCMPPAFSGQCHHPSHHQNREMTTTTSATKTTSTNLPKKTRQPNRLTTIYQRMRVDCPGDLQAYATCVENAQNSNEGVLKGLCQAEFSKVKECYQRARIFTSETKKSTTPTG